MTPLANRRSDTKIVYRRYASLFFIAGCESADNELINLEVVHRYVEQMDKYYGNVCELDIIFNFQKAYFILDELLLAGELQESSKKNVLRCIGQQDSLEDMEVSGDLSTPLRVLLQLLGIADACSLSRPRMTLLPRSCSVPSESTVSTPHLGAQSILAIPYQALANHTVPLGVQNGDDLDQRLKDNGLI
jgi:hypothetical protein